MSRNIVIPAIAAAIGMCFLIGFWGCGTSVFEQSYAVQSGATPITKVQFGDKTEMKRVMQQIRTTNLNLVDRLAYGTPEDIVRQAVSLNVAVREVSNYQPAFATATAEEAATFKKLSHDVEDWSIEVAKAVDGGQPEMADQAYVRIYLSCNQCHRFFRVAPKSVPPMEIPQLETPKPAPKEGETTTPEEKKSEEKKTDGAVRLPPANP
jgi:hypothetical protein